MRLLTVSADLHASEAWWIHSILHYPPFAMMVSMQGWFFCVTGGPAAVRKIKDAAGKILQTFSEAAVTDDMGLGPQLLRAECGDWDGDVGAGPRMWRGVCVCPETFCQAKANQS